MKKLFPLAAIFLLFTQPLLSQAPKYEMAQLMRSDGRIYVVIAVMLAILAGLILYLIRLDRKIAKMENLK
ncbi:MAG: CcmD family protein [Bacteroidetes bacterium]|nr:CcmD family protein [Bacteroidota bacterium]